MQEFLIEELARRAFDITAKSNRDMISYNDIGRDHLLPQSLN